jgi:hypothetical protein
MEYIDKIESWPKCFFAVALIAVDAFKQYKASVDDDRLKKMEAELVSIRNGLAFKS